MKKKIHQLLIDIGLKGMDAVLDRELAEARKKGRSTEQVLYRLLRQEYAHRQERSMHYRMKQAKIPS